MCGIWGLLSLQEYAKQYDLGVLYNKFNQIKPRGPDKSVLITDPNYIVGFHRLAIMDTSIQGDQPFSYSTYYLNDKQEKILRTVYLTVNGEIYNWAKLRSNQELKDFCSEISYTYKSESDCEVILPMFLSQIKPDSYSTNNKIFESGISDLLTKLDGEFAFSIYDIHHNLTTNKTYRNLWTGRDRFGIRPLFYSQPDPKTIVFGSEIKSIEGLSSNKVKVQMCEPRSWYLWTGNSNSDKLEMYKNQYYWIGNLPIVRNPDPIDVYRMCRTLLMKSVIERLHSDREVGCLLSGGLDSSLIAAIASEELKSQGRVLRTFSIGMPDSPDVKYANIVAQHIGSLHTNIEIPTNEWVDAIREVIRIGETFDITTVRATTGQYLISKKIAETTNIKVLLIGDGSDEATGGYLYFHKAPSPMALHAECVRLLDWIHYYDVLRADRGIASNGLEARVPFLSHEFINFYLQVDPILRAPRSHILSTGQIGVFEKYLLRKSFDCTGLLPECVLWRKKEAFSDGVSSESKSWYQIVQEKAEQDISDELFESVIKTYQNHVKLTGVSIVIPHTKEALYYHMIFDEFYPNQYHIIPYYWMPKWIEGATDPSARTLSIYKEVENTSLNTVTNTNLRTSNYNSVILPR